MKKYSIEISKKNLELLFLYANSSSKEVCGVLIGKKIKRYKFQITHIVFDSDSYDQSSFGVIRNTSSLYPKVRELIQIVDNNIDYIGDWHSHVKSSCGYSFKDYCSMCSLLKNQDYNFLDEIFLIIINQYMKIRVFVFMRQKRKPVDTKLIII